MFGFRKSFGSFCLGLGCVLGGSLLSPALGQLIARPGIPIFPPVSFEDKSALLSSFNHRSLVNGGGGLAGAAWFDFDKDMDLDLFLTNGIGGGPGEDNALFQYDSVAGTFSNVWGTVGPGVNTLGNSGVVAADFDNDGWEDLLLTGDYGLGQTVHVVSPLVLLKNVNGTKFCAMSSTGLATPGSALSAAVADVNNDGFVDVFVAAPGSLEMNGLKAKNALFLNNGNMTFTDISAASGVDVNTGTCVAFFSDYNDDGWIDLFIGNGNDFINGTVVQTQVLPIPNSLQLFENVPSSNKFRDVSGCVQIDDSSGFWMGMGPFDYDNDGDIDFHVTSAGNGHVLYRNDGGSYVNRAPALNVQNYEFGWGNAPADFDNDGFTDLFFAGALASNGFNIIGPGSGNPGTLLFNFTKFAGIFFKYSSPNPIPVNLSSRFTSGVAAADYDCDGFVDLLICVEEFGGDPGTPVLLRNLGNSKGSVTLRLEGGPSNFSAIGARVTVTAGTLVQTKEVYGGTSVLSTHSKWLTFGIQNRPSTDQILVKWPSGSVETFGNVLSGAKTTLVEGSGTPVP